MRQWRIFCKHRTTTSPFIYQREAINKLIAPLCERVRKQCVNIGKKLNLLISPIYCNI